MLQRCYSSLEGCSLQNYVFNIVVEEDEHEDGRPAFRAYCAALESMGAATWGDTREEAIIESRIIYRQSKQREDCFQKAVIKRGLRRMRRSA